MEYVDAGPDRFRALLLAEACRAEGVEVGLLAGDDDGSFPWWGVVQHHRLLVHSSDRDTVTRIIQRMEG